jgi:hypothetical protein
MTRPTYQLTVEDHPLYPPANELRISCRELDLERNLERGHQ